MNWRNIKNIKKEEYEKKLLIQVAYPSHTLHFIGRVKMDIINKPSSTLCRQIWKSGTTGSKDDLEWQDWADLDIGVGADIFYVLIDEIKM